MPKRGEIVEQNAGLLDRWSLQGRGIAYAIQRFSLPSQTLKKNCQSANLLIYMKGLLFKTIKIHVDLRLWASTQIFLQVFSFLA